MLTILYITANVEDEVFENKIRGKLLEVAGNNPIVSISQKPIDLGHNICVGEVGASYSNAAIQLLIGAQYATTEYVAIAEADQLYPPGYFDYIPDGTRSLYMNEDLYILRVWDRNRFWKKEYGDWTVIVKRLYFITKLKQQLNENFEWGKRRVHSTFPKRKWGVFNVGAPVISIKTPRNLSRVTGLIENSAVKELPHWGEAIKISEYLGLNINLGL